MRLIFLNRFYWPEESATGQLLTDLAEGLAQAGHDVRVITSRPQHEAAEREEVRHRVRILRLRGTRWARVGLLGKAVDFITFFIGALWRLGREAERNTIVVALTDPPLLGIGAWFVTRLRGAQLIHWIQDIYPELAIELAGQHWLRLVRPLRNTAWRKASLCVTLGRDMAAVINAAGVQPSRLQVSPNWAPAGLAPLRSHTQTDAARSAWGLSGKFVVAYSGNLGRVHDLAPVLEVADALRDAKEIAFVFIGAGPQRAGIEAEAARRRLPNVAFQPPQSRAQLATTLSIADLHLVTLRPGCERLVFPSKLYGIAAVGRPMLFIGPPECEIARITTENQIGRAAPRDDIRGIAAHIRELAANPTECKRLSESAERFSAANTASIAIDRWSSVIAALQRAECRPLSA